MNVRTVDRDDVRMADAREPATFGDHLVEGDGIGRGDEFECDVAIEFRIACTIHDPVAAFSED